MSEHLPSLDICLPSYGYGLKVREDVDLDTRAAKLEFPTGDDRDARNGWGIIFSCMHEQFGIN